MAKPIFIMQFPIEVPQETSLQVSEQLTQKLDDYHVLCYRDKSTESVAFTVLNAIDVNEEELKTAVDTILNQIQNTNNHE
jgi:hypothetical protein